MRGYSNLKGHWVRRYIDADSVTPGDGYIDLDNVSMGSQPNLECASILRENALRNVQAAMGMGLLSPTEGFKRYMAINANYPVCIFCGHLLNQQGVCSGCGERHE